MDDPAPPARKGWKANLVAGLLFALVGLLLLGGATKNGHSLQPPYSYVLGGGTILLGVLVALGVLDRLRPRRA
ncbi:MAG TPA: hypothetical protein VM241_03840 [Candidatus Thermoplasmatota archaeon]|nr:hypothetical protein [Candidatus Thermoplasmatota archaeon]